MTNVRLIEGKQNKKMSSLQEDDKIDRDRYLIYN
jgi:hypothetical protein